MVGDAAKEAELLAEQMVEELGEALKLGLKGKPASGRGKKKRGKGKGKARAVGAGARAEAVPSWDGKAMVEALEAGTTAVVGCPACSFDRHVFQ